MEAVVHDQICFNVHHHVSLHEGRCHHHRHAHRHQHRHRHCHHHQHHRIIITIIISSIIIIGIIAIVVVIVIMISITIAVIIIAIVFVIVISNITVVTIISFSRFILNTRICVSSQKFRGGTFPVVTHIYCGVCLLISAAFLSGHIVV